MEKCALSYIKTNILSKHPVHANQHAYQAGKSTITALDKIIRGIEEGVTNQSICLGVFIDISGAFDRIDPVKAIVALRRRGIPEEICAWYEYYLLNRYSSVTIKGVQKCRKINLGIPQGGVMSTLLWILSFDDLLMDFDEDRVANHSYADDCTLLLCGNNLPDMFTYMQAAVNKVNTWAKSYGLGLSQEKTVVCIFTRKTKKRPDLFLDIDGARVPEVKCLGVTLDHKLAWTDHINEKVKKCTNMLYQARAIVGKNWGVKPRYMLWLWTNVVRPSLLYTAYLWGHALQTNKQLCDTLRKLNRLGLVMLGHFRQATPTRGLEVVTGTLPLHLEVKRTGIMTSIQVGNTGDEWDRMERFSQAAFRTHSDHFLSLTNQLEIDARKSDVIPTTDIWPQYRVDTASFDQDQPPPTR